MINRVAKRRLLMQNNSTLDVHFIRQKNLKEISSLFANRFFLTQGFSCSLITISSYLTGVA
jgi:hypothetical protein